MKHKGEIEEHVLRWLQEGYTISEIYDERNNAILRFKKEKDWLECPKKE